MVILLLDNFSLEKVAIVFILSLAIIEKYIFIFVFVVVFTQPKLETDSDDCDYKPHGIVSRQKVRPPNETTARRSQRFIQNKDKDANKSQIKTEDCDDDNDVKPSKRVTPQKSNNSDKTNGPGLASSSELSPAKAELRRLQIYGAGPKMPGIKSKSKETTPNKSRMNGNSRAPRQSANRRNHADPLAKYGE